MQTATLYQFELCPYCHKVKAALDVKGIPYAKVDVNPMTKKELPELPADAPKKVPVLEFDGDRVYDSTDILMFLDGKRREPIPLVPDDPAARDKALQVEQWVDDDLSYVLPTVIYGSWSDAARAAKVVARTSNFGFVQNAIVRGGGSLIMHQVAKRIIKKRGGGNPQQLLDAELDRFEQWLGDADFVCGDAPSIGDIAAHGCLTCIRDFPAFATIMQRPRIAAWYERVQAIRDANRAQA
ncbi:MAG: glutathione S-transferase family protein [Deltaproteobacteria bacterium]|nr:MAG: glutathione S-transferase family protein [Deltaproteobacteria bacterium]